MMLAMLAHFLIMTNR